MRSTPAAWPRSSRPPTLPLSAARSVNSAPPCCSVCAAKPSPPEPKLLTSTDPEPRSTRRRRSGHLWMSQRLPRNGQVDMSQQGRVDSLQDARVEPFVDSSQVARGQPSGMELTLAVRRLRMRYELVLSAALV